MHRNLLLSLLFLNITPLPCLHAADKLDLSGEWQVKLAQSKFLAAILPGSPGERQR